jgi:hypothetical protein
MIKYDPKEVIGQNQYKMLPEGDYELSIEEAGMKKTKRDVEYIQVKFLVRGDVEQNQQGRFVFESIWKAKATGEWADYNLKHMLVACNVPQKEYEDYNELLLDLEGRNLRGHVYIDVYNDKESNKIKYYMETKFPTKSLTPLTYSKDKNESEVNSETVDDGLPF